MSSKVVHSAEAGVSSQKWILTADQYIELDSHDYYVLGSSEIKDGATVLLGTSNASNSVKTIQWKFSVPVFGKGTTKSSTAYTISKAIEDGAAIESAQEVPSVKKSSLSLTRTNTKSSYVIYREYRLIISWWRIIFIRRLSMCRTQEEYLDVIEQYRQILYSRFAQYLSVYGTSVSREERRALEQSIEETKSTLENEVFTKSTTYLKTLKSDQVVLADKFDISAIVTKSCTDLDKKYEAIVIKAEKKNAPIKKTTSGNAITENKSQLQVDSVLGTIDTIQVTIRYWYRTLYIRITEASKNGAKPEKTQKLIKDSHQEVQNELKKLDQSATTTVTGCTTLSDADKKTLKQSVTTVIEKSNNELDHFVSSIDESSTTVSVEDWKKLTNDIDSKLTIKFDECKKAVHECDTVSNTELEKEQVIEHVTQEDAQDSTIEIVTTLAESKAYVVSWFTNVSNDITWSINNQTGTDSQKDTLTILDAAELDIISKIDESTALISVLSSNLTYLTWTERRRLITYYVSMKVYLLANIKKFRYSVVESTDKDTILKICDCTFGKEGQDDAVKNIDEILETVTIKGMVSTSTIVIENEKGTTTVIDVDDESTGVVDEKKGTVSTVDTVTVGVISDKNSTAPNKQTKSSTVVITDQITSSSNVDIIDKDTQSLTIGVIDEDKTTSSQVDVITNVSDSITVGSVNVGETTTVETIIQNQDSVTIGATLIDKISLTADTEKQTTSHVEEVEDAAIVGTIVTGVVSDKKDTTSKVDTITKDSETVTIGVISDKEDTIKGTGKVTVGVITGDKKDTHSKVDVITKDSEKIIVGVIADGKKDTCSKVDTIKHTSTHVDAVAGGIVAGGIISDAVSGVSDKKDSISKVDVITKDSEKITVGVITAEEKKTHSEVDVITKDSKIVTIGVIDDKKHTSTHAGAVVGGVIAGGIIAGVISNIVSDKKDTDKKDTNKKDTNKKDSEKKDSEKKDTISKVDIVSNESEKVTVGVVVDEEDTTSKVEIITKESEVVTIGVITEKDTKIDDVAKDSEKVVVGVVTDKKGTDSKVDIITKDSEIITIKDATIIASKPVKGTVIAEDIKKHSEVVVVEEKLPCK